MRRHVQEAKMSAEKKRARNWHSGHTTINSLANESIKLLYHVEIPLARGGHEK